MANRQRTYVLATLLVLLTLLTTVMLSSVLATVFFAVTVSYVLYPLSEWFIDRGLSKRLAAIVSTAIAFVLGSLVVIPLIAVLYIRWRDLFAFFRQLPADISIAVGEMQYTIDVQSALVGLRQALTNVAVDIAGETPILALKVVLFTILVYAMLWQPKAPGRAVYQTIPVSYHDLVSRFHKRLRSTL